MNLQIYLLDSLRFASLTVYRPGRPRPEDTDRTRDARQLTWDLKEGIRVQQVAAYVAKQVQSGMLRDFFGDDVTIVPAPGSAPLSPGGIWPSGLLATALDSQLFLGTEHRLLERKTRVQKAAFAPGLKQRPTAELHYETITLSTSLPLVHPSRVTIVDDVVTTGATLLGCASRVQQTFPDADVRGFAVMRSLTRMADGGYRQISKVLDPVHEGRIVLQANGRTRRTP